MRNFHKRIHTPLFMYFKARVLDATVVPVVSQIMNSKRTRLIIKFEKRTNFQHISGITRVKDRHVG